LTRLKRPDEALSELRIAAEFDAHRARYAYVYAVALHSAGQGEQAMTVLKQTLVAHPGDRDVSLAIISFARDAGDVATALDYAKRLAQLAPADTELRTVIDNLQRQADKAAAQ